jgi:hypothetical protein
VAKELFGALANPNADPPERATAATADRGGGRRDGAGQLKSSTVDRYRPATPIANQDHREPILTVCNGRETIAYIFAAGDAYLAALATGTSLGIFPRLKEARAAITEAVRR